jgi:leader peptidase (prepilin peptidase)/N-methyltransferase
MTVDPVALTALAILGLAVGSFLNVCIHRLPHKASIVSPSSHCPHCGYVLRWFDNIPVVSYVVLGGRCRDCKAWISIRYPIVELITMIVRGPRHRPWSRPLAGPEARFRSVLIVLFAIDLEHHLLPNVITLPGILVGLAFSLFLPPGVIDALLGVLVGGETCG